MIAITGAGGFIGRHVVRALAGGRCQVRALGRDVGKTKAALAGVEGVEVVEGDVTDVESLSAAFRGCEQVIHLVGIILARHGASFEKIHIKGTANVIEAARHNRIERMILVSGMGAGPKARSRYGRSKWQAEEALRSSGLDYAIVRPSVVFGPDDHFVSDFVRLLGWAPLLVMPGGGRTLLQPVWVEDLAAIIVQLAGRERLGGIEVAVGGAQALSLKKAVRAIMAAVGRRRPLLGLPFWLARWVAFLCEAIMRRPPLTRDQVLMLQEGRFTCDVAPLIEQFGVDLMSFEKGLEILFHKEKNQSGGPPAAAGVGRNLQSR
ncbi:MAG: complex I NDUFA9 subunit family protein [Candidatus Sumerlaeia bacterium]